MGEVAEGWQYLTSDYIIIAVAVTLAIAFIVRGFMK